MGCCVDLDMRRYIVLLLITGIVWAQTDLDKLVLKDGTTYLGEYSKTEGKIVFFKPQGAFTFQPIPVKRIRRLELKEGQTLLNGGGILIKRSTKEKAIYDAKSINLNKWAFYAPFSTITFGGCMFMYFQVQGDLDFIVESPIFFGGSLAASLAIPYFVLNKEEKFTYPKSLTDDDRLYYKKIYSNKLKQRKFIYIVGSTIVTGAVAFSMFMYYFNATFSIDASFGP